MSTCTQTITINDTTPPTANCPADLTVECVAEVPLPDISLVTAMDNCGNATVSHVGDVSDNAICPEVITRTYQAVDDCGNVTTCTQIITINDTTPPVISSCPPDQSFECAADVPAPDISLLAATDNCGNVTITHVSDVSDNAACPEVITRTYQATDDCGNAVTCTQTITIAELILPSITCPADITVECIAEVPAPDISLVTASDNCGNVTVTHVSDVSDNATCPEVITRTYQAVDGCGNVSTCTQTITISDTTPPTMTCPADITVECVAEVPPVDISLVLANDNCGNVTVSHVGDVSDNATCPEIITRTYQAIDDCGNITTCTQTITIDDTTPPTMSCPADLTVECVAEVPAADISLVTATDNCGNVTVTHVGDVSDNAACPEIITRTYQAIDDCGNITTCTQTITINDTTPPNISCPADLNFECVGSIPAPDISLVTATDNCGNVTITHVGDVSNNAICPEIITRTYQAEDDCGNVTTCTQTFTINDTTPPSITSCPPAQSLECVADVPAPDISLVTATDNCGAVTISHVGDVSDNSTCPEVITRTYQAEDDCGNITTCTQVFTINDVTPPVLDSAPADVTVECEADIPAMINLNWTDNCDGSGAVTGVDIDNGGACPRVITRTWTYTDACGNVVSVSQSITVEDTTRPDFNLGNVDATILTSSGATCPSVADISLVIDRDNPLVVGDTPIDFTVHGITFQTPNANVTDNCTDPDSLRLYVWNIQDDYNNDADDCTRTIRVVFRLFDECDNRRNKAIEYTIQDDSPPTLNCPAPVNVQCYDDVPNQFFTLAALNAAGGSASDNCTLDNNSITLINETEDGICPRVITRTYRISDVCGNTTTCDHVITIEDTTPPTIFEIPDNVNIDCVDCIQSFQNGDFEQPGFPGNWRYLPENQVPGWETTATDNIIEIQKSGGVDGVISYSGNYHAELNGTQNSDFFQQFCTGTYHHPEYQFRPPQTDGRDQHFRRYYGSFCRTRLILLNQFGDIYGDLYLRLDRAYRQLSGSSRTDEYVFPVSCNPGCTR